jgi:N-methylhydantoinase B/oxoprolinase/acetone carboxylase alpha subunit
MEAPGSGGYGPPSARDPALLRQDRADGYVTETWIPCRAGKYRRKPRRSPARRQKRIRLAPETTF